MRSFDGNDYVLSMQLVRFWPYNSHITFGPTKRNSWHYIYGDQMIKPDLVTERFHLAVNVQTSFLTPRDNETHRFDYFFGVLLG